MKEMPPSDEKRCCGFINVDTYDGVVSALSFVSILLTLIVVLILTVTAPTRDSVFRVAGLASAAQVVGGPGETGALYSFQLTMDWNDNRVFYAVQKLENTTTDVTGIYIRGPILPYMNVGALTGALCGAPTTACDTTSIPGVVQGVIQNTIFNGVIISGIDIRPVVESIRAYPELFYLELTTNGVPASPGAARGPLYQSSGFA
jgi:hypothetical protein